jgi:hypothetical protein
VSVRLRVVVAVFVALVLVAVIGIYAVVRGLSSGLPLRIPVQECVVIADGTATYDPEQMANAATIAAVGIRRGLPAQALVIALAAAQQESKLENLSGGDRDSIGLFQQRPSQGWGTPDQLNNPRYAAGKFYDALLKVRGWQQMSVAQAAQAVQKSADGSAYARWEDKARMLTTALSGDTPRAVGCTIVDKPAQRGTAAAAALAAGMAADWGPVPTVAEAGLVGLAVKVDEPRTGWRYAHWLVAHADDQNIRQVRYGDQVWTASASTWSRSNASSLDHVVAEVWS